VGLDYAPAYLAPTTRGEQLLRGVNYASGAAGILDESGASFVSPTPPCSLTYVFSLVRQYVGIL